MAAADNRKNAVMDGGDLGLGRGWMPGAIPKSDSDDEVERLTKGKTKSMKWNHRANQFVSPYQSGRSSRSSVFHDCHDNSETSSICSERLSVRSESSDSIYVEAVDRFGSTQHITDLYDSETGKDHNNGMNMLNGDHGNGKFDPNVDLVGDSCIPLGTSLRQQRQLFDYNVHELFAATYPADDEKVPSTRKNKKEDTTQDNGKKVDAKLLQKKLLQANTENESLKEKLEQCQKHLQSKHKAISILQKECHLSNSEIQKSSKKTVQTNHKLQQDINKLQFELDYKQSTLMNSQQKWSERFDRLSQENSALMATLEARSLEMRKITAEKFALVQERDELLALLDIQEREQYNSLHPQSSEDQPFSEYSTAELAILGACQCRHQSPDPCNCSRAAANLKRELLHLNDQLGVSKQQHQESLTTVDVYRKAFDEQLNKNKHLVRELAEMTASIMSNNNKVAKFKAAMKWLLQQLNEAMGKHQNSDHLPPTHVSNGERLSEQMVEDKTEQELILMLVEMVSDKNEALAHQRLAARLLADRAKELEAKLAAYKDQSQEKPPETRETET